MPLVKASFNAKLFIPTWDSRVHFSQIPMMIRETSLSRHLVDIEFMTHMAIDRARFAITDELEKNDDLDMAIMLDADQSVECLDGPAERSWVDEIVSQYMDSSWPYEFIFGITPMSHSNGQLNFWQEGSEKAATSWDRNKKITQCGTGMMAIPKRAWMHLKRFHPNPWFPDKEDMSVEVSEDIRMTRRAVKNSINLTPAIGVRVYHWPTWIRELVYPNLPN